MERSMEHSRGTIDAAQRFLSQSRSGLHAVAACVDRGTKIMADANLAQDTRANIEAQIIELRNEMGRLSKSLQARASDVAEDAEDAFETVKSRAAGAAKTVRRQAHVVSEAIGDNPGTAAAVLSSAGVMGLLVGFAAGYILASGSRR
ncbi:DUF3618 domain-containing protein [Xanthobacter autotrophicus]|uniref:DUF3618 domain-containing protein n=1 Tax=Xanthobacter autotrophicus TaxID=280 RepID=UPI003727C8EF